MKAMGNGEDLLGFLRSRPQIQGVRWDNESIVCRLEGTQDAELAQLLRAIVEQGIARAEAQAATASSSVTAATTR